MFKPITKYFDEKTDKRLLVALFVVLIFYYANFLPSKFSDPVLAFFASIATLPVLASAFASIREKKISVDLLAGIALLFSLINREWASAVFINSMLTSARLFSSYTEKKSRSVIKSLLKIRPQKVKIKKGKDVFEESVSRVKKGDLLVIELGDRIPVDGVVVSGEAMIDQSSLTGESIPVCKKKGDKVLSSTLNVSGTIVLKTEKVGKNTVFEKIIRLVEASQKEKVGIRSLADKFASVYVVMAFLGAIVLYLVFRDPALVLSVLLVTCADDIAVAVPMAFAAAMGSAAQSGIIVKGGEYLEVLTKVKTVILDKTGTITKGKMQVREIVPQQGFDKDEVLKLAAIADFFSKHPIAKAIVECAKKRGIKYEEPEEYEEASGRGAVALFKGKKVVCGRLSFLQEYGIKTKKWQIEKMNKLKEEKAANVLPVGFDKEIVGFLVLADETRPEVKKAIDSLRSLGVKKFVILTGDNEKAAAQAAEETGIKEYYANLLPEEKVKYVKKHLGGEDKVAMVGDGINDAASLAISDVGIAMGAIGTDAAIEAADVALMKDDISKIPEAVKLSRKVMSIAWQDFWIWGIVNFIGLFLVFSKIIGPEGAAAYNFITDFLPLLNSLRLFKYKINKSF